MEDSVNRPQRRRGLILSLLGLLVVALVVVVGLTVRGAGGNSSAGKGKKKDESKETPAAPVELSQARRGEISTFLVTTTTLEARNSAVLVSRQPGQVLAIPAEEGQWVKRGDVLARLDDREARLAVQRAELEAEVKKRELDRGRQLHEKGYLSEKELDDLELFQRNAVVDLEQRRYELSQMALTAPFSGRVAERMINLGETVTVGKECFRIVDFNPLRGRLYFPERELTRVRVGQMAVLTMDSQPGREFSAEVSLVNPVVDRTNGTFKVTVEVSNDSGELRPGAFARVRLETGRHEDALLVARRGVLSEDGDHYVFVARGDSAVRVMVRVGAIDGDTAQILEGVEAGDRIVTVGHGGLKSGAKIKAVTL